MTDETTSSVQGPGEPLPPPPSHVPGSPRRRIGLLVGSLAVAVAVLAAVLVLGQNHPRPARRGTTGASLDLPPSRWPSLEASPPATT